MPRTAIQEKCADCGRTLYGSDFVRGLAKVYPFPQHDDPMGELFAHTYDCKDKPRRLSAPPAPEGTDGNP